MTQTYHVTIERDGYGGQAANQFANEPLTIG